MPYLVETDHSSLIEIEDSMLDKMDFLVLPNQRFHALIDNKGYRVELLHVNLRTKELTLLINGQKHHFKIKEEIDVLLDSMGFSRKEKRRIDKIKSPMPGLVIEVPVATGQEVKEGDKLIVLEAMKMENIIKSPVSGVIHKVGVQPGDNIAKGHLLIEFENQ